MSDGEVKLYLSMIRWGAAIILSVIWAITIYQAIWQYGPVRPVQSQQYYWPK